MIGAAGPAAIGRWPTDCVAVSPATPFVPHLSERGGPNPLLIPAVVGCVLRDKTVEMLRHMLCHTLT